MIFRIIRKSFSIFVFCLWKIIQEIKFVVAAASLDRRLIAQNLKFRYTPHNLGKFVR